MSLEEGKSDKYFSPPKIANPAPLGTGI